MYEIISLPFFLSQAQYLAKVKERSVTVRNNKINYQHRRFLYGELT